MRVRVAGIAFDDVDELAVVSSVMAALTSGRGGWIVTPNVDIARLCAQDPAAAELVRGADLVVADGVPVLWLARLAGSPLRARVTGSALIYSLTAAAAATGHSVYLLGGEEGVPQQAAERLAERYEGLPVAGADAPPLGFDTDPEQLAEVVERVTVARPDLVYVGLGFPRQERLIVHLQARLPSTWFLGCGAAIPMAAGVLDRAPGWMQDAGLEWFFRLGQDPRRLLDRYVRRDAPFLARSAWSTWLARRAATEGRVKQER